MAQQVFTENCYVANSILDSSEIRQISTPLEADTLVEEVEKYW